MASNGYGQPIEYTKVCSIYGQGFFYIPGTDICLKPDTRDARQQTRGGTWRTQVPYSEGEWISDPAAECGTGKLVKVGAFKSTDFSVQRHERKTTLPVPLNLNTNQFISKVMMSGGFYDPRIPGRAGVNGAGLAPTDGLCLRTYDEDIISPREEEPVHISGFDANLAIGCISNSRIVNMPQIYSTTATLAYPQIFFDNYKASGNGAPGPFTVGHQLIVTTDYGPTGPRALTYCDATAGSCGGGDIDPNNPNNDDPKLIATYTPLGAGVKPLAGTLSVWACVETGN